MDDNYIFNAFFHTVRREYNKYREKNPNLIEFEKMYFPGEDMNSMRILSCNHYIHFQCYFTKFMESDLCNYLTNFSCPFCRKQGETFIPLLTQFSYEQTKGYLKGFNFFLYNNEYY